MTVRWSMCLKHGWGAGGHPEPRRLVRIRVLAPRYRGSTARHLRHRREFAGSEERQGEYMHTYVWALKASIVRTYFLYACVSIVWYHGYRGKLRRRPKVYLVNIERATPVFGYTYTCITPNICTSIRYAVVWESCERQGPQNNARCVYRPALLSRAPSVAPVCFLTSHYFLFSHFASSAASASCYIPPS